MRGSAHRSVAAAFVAAACAPELGQQPEEGAYSECSEDADCGEGLSCFTRSNDGICTERCAQGQNGWLPADCPPPPPGSDADLMCFFVGNGPTDEAESNCALACTKQNDCPDGMRCVRLEVMAMTGDTVTSEFCM